VALTPERYLRLVRLRTLRNRRSELDDYLDVARQRRRMYPRAALVGALSGLLASVFRMLLTGAGNALDALLVWSHAHDGLLRLAPVATMAATAALAVWLVRRFAPEAAGSGIPNLKAVLLRLRPMRAMRLLAVKLVGGVLAIGGGLVLGREGPTVQMGGAVGDEVARRMGSPPRERLTLTAAGAGAGLAAAFNAPLSGLVFVLEDVQRDFRPIVFGAAFVAAAAANVVSRFLSGVPRFHRPVLPNAAAGGAAVLRGRRRLGRSVRRGLQSVAAARVRMVWEGEAPGGAGGACGRGGGRGGAVRAAGGGQRAPPRRRGLARPVGLSPFILLFSLPGPRPSLFAHSAGRA